MNGSLFTDKNFWSGLIFVGVGSAFSVGALNYSLGTTDQPGPGFFPFGLGIALALLGAVLLVRVLLVASESDSNTDRWAWRPLLVVVVSLVIFALLLPRAGMLVALPVLVAMSSYAGDEVKWQEALVSSVVLTFVSWLLFVRVLRLEIPLWPVWPVM